MTNQIKPMLYYDCAIQALYMMRNFSVRIEVKLGNPEEKLLELNAKMLATFLESELIRIIMRDNKHFFSPLEEHDKN